MITRVSIDEGRHIWRAEARIPLAELGPKPGNGTRWRINLYRADQANRAWLAFNPTLQSTFHVPERFGWLEFTGH